MLRAHFMSPLSFCNCFANHDQSRVRRRLAIPFRSRRRRTTPATMRLGAVALCGLLCLFVFAAPSGADTIQVEITDPTNDSEELLGTDTIGTSSSDLELGTQILSFLDPPGVFRQAVGLRFVNIGIPQGSTISSASIQFMVDEVSDMDISLRISGELVPDAAPYLDDVPGDVLDRASTSSVLWSDVPPWLNEGDSGPAQQTPDLAAIVQDIVDQPGWSAGNAMSFVIHEDPIENDTNFRVAVAADKASGNPRLHGPILNVDFTAALPLLEGDYDGSGTVEQADLDLVLLNWGNATPPVPAGWVNNLPSGGIDQQELDNVLLNWGNAASSAQLASGAGVPEPQAWVLLMISCVLGATMRTSASRHNLKRSIATCSAVLLAISWPATHSLADTFGTGANTFDFECVTIGDPGNPPAPNDGNRHRPGREIDEKKQDEL